MTTITTQLTVARETREVQIEISDNPRGIFGNVVGHSFAYRFKTGEKVHVGTSVIERDGVWTADGTAVFNNRNARLTGWFTEAGITSNWKG